MGSQEDALPASSSGRAAAAAGSAAAKRKRSLPEEMEINGKASKQGGKNSKRKGFQPDAAANNSMHKEQELQQESNASELTADAQDQGYTPHGHDVFARVACKQREHLLGAKIGASTFEGTPLPRQLVPFLLAPC